MSRYASGYSAFSNGPVTQQAVVSVNGGIDRIFCNFRQSSDKKNVVDCLETSDEHCYTIQQRELVFRLNPRLDAWINRPSSNGVNDIALKVFSSANNFCKPVEGMTANPISSKQMRVMLREMVSFVGVAMTPIDYTNTNQKDSLAVQVAGSVTIHNTGSKIIRPGDKIIWDFPETSTKDVSYRNKRAINGEPLSKKLFAVLPLEAALRESSVGGAVSPEKVYDFVEYITLAHPHFDPANLPTEESRDLYAVYSKCGIADRSPAKFKEYLRRILSLYEEVRSRVIGIALSGAGPGDPFDIMLCSGH